MAVCPHCHRSRPDTFNYCQYCGASPTSVPRGTIPMSGIRPVLTDMFCPFCGAMQQGPNRGLHIVTGTGGQQIRCATCNHVFSRSDLGLSGVPFVPPAAVLPPQRGRPRYNAANVPHAQRLSVVAGKRTRGKLWEILMFEIAGVLSLYIPTFFGFPPLTYLAIALMVWIPIYSVLPSESQVVGSLGGGRITHDSGGYQVGSLTVKSIAKLIAFFFIIYQSFVSFFALRIICVAVSLLFYFSLRTSYRTSQPYNMIEAWVRMALGFFIAWILALTFAGTGPGVGIGLVFMWFGAAFFATLPVHIPDQDSVINISFLERGLGSRQFQLADKVLFAGIMLMAFVFFLSSTGGGWGIDRVMFYLFFGFSLFAGVSTGPEGRPALGIVMIFILMFVMMSSYPGYVGQAFFGYWWPQIQSFTSIYMGPLNSAWFQAQSGMGDAWEMITCPQCYFIKQQQLQTVTKSVITTGGTPMSIEINRFQLTPTVLEPSEPVVGVMDLQNNGNFISGSMALDLWSTYTDPTSQKEYLLGEVSNLQCSVAGPGASYYPPANFNGSTYPITTGSCSWNSITYPTETRSVTFMMEPGNGWGPLYGACQDNSNSSSPTYCTCFQDAAVHLFGDCPLNLANTTYYFGGQTVKVNANLTYQYVVNVSLPVSVIGFQEYVNELQSGAITLQDFTSEYTGGPVKATLFTQQQPARNDTPFIVIAAIYNDGPGEILNVTNFTVKIYGGNMVDGVTVLGYDFRINAPTSANPAPDGCTPVVNQSVVKGSDGNFIITCQNRWKSLKPGEYKRVSFYVNAGSVTADKRTTLIVGQADYTYRKTTSQMLTMSNAPPQ